VRLDVQLLGDRLPRDTAALSDQACSIVHERAKAEHVDLPGKHRQAPERLALVVVDEE